MAIETLDDWNARLSCCCGMPECPEPIIECSSAGTDGYFGGYLSYAGDTSRWEVTVQTWAGGGWYRYTGTNLYQVYINGVLISSASDVTVTNNGGPFTGAITTTYEGEITPSAGRAELLSIISAALTTGDYTGVDCESSYYEYLRSGTLNPALLATYSRTQFLVPSSFTGSYFAVTFDVIEEPDGWEEEETDPRTFHAQDVTREWEGPGSGDQDDPSWHLGEPYEIAPPSTPGLRRIVNIRYQCYRGPYGSKPQLMGDGVELPAP